MGGWKTPTLFELSRCTHDTMYVPWAEPTGAPASASTGDRGAVQGGPPSAHSCSAGGPTQCVAGALMSGGEAPCSCSGMARAHTLRPFTKSENICILDHGRPRQSSACRTWHLQHWTACRHAGGLSYRLVFDHGAPNGSERAANPSIRMHTLHHSEIMQISW